MTKNKAAAGAVSRARRLHLLGVTSLWLVFPVACRATRPEVQLLSHWTVVVCAASTLRYWLLGVGSLRPGVWREGFGIGRHVDVADRVCAALMFVALVAFFALGERGAPRWLTLVAFPAAVAALFAASRFWELARPQPVTATACHLAFRFVGFWWVCLALTPPGAGSALQCAVTSTLYWCHIAYSALPEKEPCFHRCYLRGCAEVLTLVALSVPNGCADK